MEPAREEEPSCPDCAVALVRLGGAKVKTKDAQVEIEHFACPSCGRRRMKHSRGGFRDTAVDLEGG